MQRPCPGAEKSVEDPKRESRLYRQLLRDADTLLARAN
jgi:hypothetical protein